MNTYLIFAVIALLFTVILITPLIFSEKISNKLRIYTVAFCTVFFVVGSFFLYSKFGTPEILPLIKEREEEITKLKERIVKISDEVKKNPKNLKAWIELGDGFMEATQFSAAANAYKQAVLLSAGNTELIMSYVRALILNAGGTVTEEAKKGLDVVKKIQPENEQVRYFLAIYKMQSGNTKEAMEEMKALYNSLPEDSPIKAIIDRKIGRK